jgi:hypothetical protein
MSFPTLREFAEIFALSVERKNTRDVRRAIVPLVDELEWAPEERCPCM